MRKNENTIFYIIGIVFLVALILNSQAPTEEGMIGLIPHYYKDGTEVFPQKGFLGLFTAVTFPGQEPIHIDKVSFEIVATNLDVPIENIQIVDAGCGVEKTPGVDVFKDALAGATTPQTLAIQETKTLWTSAKMDTVDFEEASPVNFWIEVSGYNTYTDETIYPDRANSGNIIFEPDPWTYSSQLVYDEIDDSWVNDSLWTNYSYYIYDMNNYEKTYEDTNNLVSQVYTNMGGFQAGHSSTNLPPLENIENVTIRVGFSTAGGMCYVGSGGSTWSGYLQMMGTKFFSADKTRYKHCDDTWWNSDTSVWIFKRNVGAGTNKFDVYNDGVFDRQITASNNIFKVYIYGGASGTGINILGGSFGYVYYTTRSR